MASFGSDFGQKVDLTASIRNILRNYPEGTAVLKELVQNADDAGAHSVSFCLDFRHHRNESVAGPELGQFQGPALLVFNDATFTDEDFRSIQRIGDSLKKSSESKAKIGRFGIGFNAVYHWTDLPSFISSKYLVMLDPQARFLPNVNPSNPGKIVDWVSNPALLTEFRDQFEPYRGHGGLEFNGRPFSGTIFRLPLRTVMQAETSMLSKRSLSEGDSRGLISALQKEASAMLLFLKNIESIEIKIWDVDQTEPTSLFRCGIANLTSELRLKRIFVGDATKQAAQGTSGSLQSARSVIPTADYSLNVQCISFNAPRGLHETYEEIWEVCNQLGGREADAIASDPANELLRLVPWGGVAAFISSSDSSSQEGVIREGLAYCFLPLPVHTNLPVMVNGFFELSSNRRDVWQGGSDMTGDGRTRAEWNISLMRDVIAPSYTRLLSRLRERLGFRARYQELWPTVNTPAPWNEVVRCTLLGCRNQRLLQVAQLSESAAARVAQAQAQAYAQAQLAAAAAASGGSKSSSGLGWVSSIMQRGSLEAMKPATAAVAVAVAVAAHQPVETWVEVSRAVLLPGSAGLDADQEIILTDILLELKQLFVACLPDLRHTLAESKTCTNIATPQLLREALRAKALGGPSAGASTGSGTGTSASTVAEPLFLPSPAMCTFLMMYCFSDLKPDRPPADLDALRMLPLCSGGSGLLRLYSAEQAAAISEVCSMGFPLSRSVQALSLHRFDVMQAFEVLAAEFGAENSSGAGENAQGAAGSNHQIFVLANEEEGAVFNGAAEMLIDKTKVGPKEIQFLSHATLQRLSNVRTFQASIVPDLLAKLLPAACRLGATERGALGEAVTEDYLRFLTNFWKFAVSRPEVISAVAQGPALVSCLGSTRFMPLASLSNLMVKMKGDVSLPQDIQEILSLVGVNLVDETLLADAGAMPKVFWEYVQGPSRSGILATLDSIMRAASLSSGAPGSSTRMGQSSGSGLAPASLSPFARLTAEQRDALRVHLASCEPVRNITSAEITIIRKLPLFTSFAEGGTDPAHVQMTYFTIDSGNPLARGPQAAGRKVERLSTINDYSRLENCLFPPHFVKYVAAQELQLLQHIGVQILRRSDFFRDELLPNASQLFRVHPTAVQSGLIEMLAELNALTQEDGNFPKVVRSTSFVPAPNTGFFTSSGDSHEGDEDGLGSGFTLYKPGELFDPHEAELVTLLDPTFFPAQKFQRDDILVFLRTLGLQASLDWPGVVSCAESIALIDDSSGVPPSELERKANRGRSLLLFLDKNISRLLGEVAKPTAPVASKSSGLGGFFNIRSLFGEKKAMESSLPIETYIESLAKIAWLPVVTEPLHPCMPWLGAPTVGGASLKSAVTAAPIQSRPVSEAWQCSASMFLVREPVSSPSLRKLLGWTAPLNFHTSAVQLREISARFLQLKAQYAKLEKLEKLGKQQDPRVVSSGEPGTAEASAADVMGPIHEVRETVTGLIPQLYQRLNALADEHGPDLLSLLDSCAWIWVGETFVSPDKVAMSTSVNASPYLFQLPQDLQVYSRLLATFRVKPAFSPRDYIQVLRQMAEESGAVASAVMASATSATAAKVVVVTAKAVTQPTSAAGPPPPQSRITALPLPDTSVDLAVSLVTLLSSEGTVDAAVQAIYVPDNTGRLALSTDLINDDVPWLSGPQYAGVRSGCRLLHPNISSSVAEKMGVKSLRLYLVNSTTNQSLFTIPEASVEAFGQSESITNRLRTILDMYPDGNPIFSELIQNADDAGATMVRIMLDENTYSAESLMDSKMAPLQGPSLLVGNDAVFTEADFRSLARIGQGSKIEKLATTGRFGLGFSSTYHLTDTPSFVSGEHLVVFDPHCAFVPGASRNQPGLRIKFQGNAITSMFKDQFEPYSYFGCDFSEPYNGTLFRFPLRSPTLARRSEISKRSYSCADVQANLDQLIGQLSHHLLFLRSVRMIKIYHCAAGQREPQLLHSAVAQSHDVMTINDQSLLRYFDKDPSGGGQPSRDQFYSKLTATPDARLPLLSYKLGISTESFTYRKVESTAPGDTSSPLHIAPEPSLAQPATAAAVAPVVEFEARLLKREDVEYLIVSGLRGGNAKRMACETSMRHLKLVPLGAVAACLSRTVLDCLEEEATGGPSRGSAITKNFPPISGQTFCFLPLPVQTQLPVHTNAYWELSSNRRDIWRGDDTKGEAKLRSEWNQHIMCDVLAPLYAQLLVRAAAIFGAGAMRSRPKRSPAGEAGQAQAITAPAVAAAVAESPYDMLSLLPCPMPAEPWTAVALALFPLLREERLLHSNVGGGAFLPLNRCYLLESTVPAPSLGAAGAAAAGLSLATQQAPSTTTTAGSAAAQATAMKQPNPPTPSSAALETAEDERKVRICLESLLVEEGIPVALVPPAILKTLLDANCVAGEVNPALVRRHFSHGLGPQSASSASATTTHASIQRGGKLSDEEVLSNAVFLLQFCFRDINRNNYDQLFELPLLPLEDGSLGEINSVTDPPLFLATDVERKLLAKAGNSIVVGDAVLGPSVAAILRDTQFAQVGNVRPIAPLDMLRLLQSVVPTRWFASTTLIVDREDIVSNEWLIGMWNYVLEAEDLLELFGGYMPMLPIMQPANLSPGSYLVKISAKIPILHMAYKDISPAAAEALNDLGLYIFDPAVLGGLSYSQEISKLIFPPSARGVLDALNAIEPAKIQEVARGWSPATRDALREVILDSFLAKIDATTPADRTMLRSLPIWNCFGGSSASAAAAKDTQYVTITDEMQLPPRGVKVALLGPDYLRIRNERDRALYQQLGLELEPAKGKFYGGYVIPRVLAGQVPLELVDEVAIELLLNLPQLAAENASLGEILSKSAIFRSHSGALCTPSNLYDPQSSALVSLLPPSAFPAAKFNDSSLLLSLRALGINTVINCSGVLEAAEGIRCDLDAFIASTKGSNPSSPPSPTAIAEAEAQLTSAVKRSKELIKYLDLHIDTLLEEADPEGLRALREIQDSGDGGGDGGGAGGAGAGAGQQLWSMVLGGAWGNELRSRTWIACHTQPPAQRDAQQAPQLADAAALPWPEETHRLPLATPSQCVLLQDMWSCSGSHRIAAVDVKTEGVRALLGWNKPVSGRVATLQLLKIKDKFDGVAAKSEVQADVLARVYYTVVPKIMDTLTVALEQESAGEIEVWMKALQRQPCIWIGGRFVETSRVAFKSPSNVNTEPFLFVLQGDALKYADLYRELGVKETFGPHDLAAMTRQLRASSGDAAPLSPQKLEVCIGILKLLVRMLKGEDEADEDSEDDSDGNGGGGDGGSSKSTKKRLKESFDDDDNSLTEGVGLPVATAVAVEFDDSDDKIFSNVRTSKPKAPTVHIQELGEIFVPDRDGRLYLGPTLTYDDAPWISAALTQRSGGSSAGSMHFVHRNLQVEEAKALGAKSLREQLFAGDEIVCPDPRALSGLLGDDAVLDTIADLVTLSDSLGSKAMHVVYDERTHPTESLMHPGLAEAQGPALVVFFDGPTLRSEEVAQLLSPSPNLPPIVPADESPSAGAAKSHSAIELSPDTRMYPRSGKRLSSVFAVTDCFQLISGREFFIFDPSGQSLLSNDEMADAESAARGTAGAKKGTHKSSGGGGKGVTLITSAAVSDSSSTRRASSSTSAAAPAAAGAVPKAQRCMLVGTKSGRSAQDNQDILTRFPDQFASFASLPFGLLQSFSSTGTFKGTLLRLPLRRAPSVVSESVPSLPELKHALRCYKGLLQSSLLVGLSHVSGTCSHWAAGDANLSVDFELSLASQPAFRNERWLLMNEKGWKRNAITSFFSKPFVAPELMSRISISVKFGALSRPEEDAVTHHQEQPTTGQASPPQVTHGWLEWRFGELATTTGTGGKSAYSLVPPGTNAATVSGTEDWLMMSTVGAGRCKDEALREPFRPLKLQPFVTLCARMCNETELRDLSSPPDTGLLMCAGGAVGASGLPFLIEAPFLQIPSTRTVPLTVPQDLRAQIPFSRQESSTRMSRQGASQTLSLSDAQTWNTALVATIFELLLPRVMFELKAALPTAAASKGFYKYWPFQSRMTRELQTVAVTAKIQAHLSRCHYYLTSTGFASLDSVIMPMHNIPSHILAYLQAALPVGVVPMQVTRDMLAENIKPNALTAALLRDFLARDAATQRSRLRGRFDLLLPLLRFCVSDVMGRPEEGEFQRRKAYRQMMGCPLLIMADASVRAFPSSRRECVFMVSDCLQALLPELRDRFLHPVLESKIQIFKNNVFLDELFICSCSTSLVEELVAVSFPPQWRNCEAVDLGAKISSGLGSVGRGLRPQGAAAAGSGGSGAATATVRAKAAPPSELLMYVLWKEILSKEAPIAFDGLRGWPIIPVVSAGRRLLLSSEMLPFLFCFEPSGDEDDRRSYLIRESGRLASLVQAESAEQVKDADKEPPNLSRDWNWTGIRAQPRRRFIAEAKLASGAASYAGVVKGPGASTRAQAGARTGSSTASASAIGVNDVDVDMDGGGEGLGSAITFPVEDNAAALAAAMAATESLVAAAGSIGSGPSQGLGGLSAPSQALRDVVFKVGIPVIDGRLFDGPPAGVTGSPHPQNTVVGLGRRLLYCMSFLVEKNVNVFECVDYSSTPTSVGPGAGAGAGAGAYVDEEMKLQGFILQFDGLSVDERRLLLEEIYKSHRASAFSPAEIDKLKTLRLFTVQPTSSSSSSSSSPTSLAPVAIADCTSGTYWCASDSVLDGVNIPGFGLSSDSPGGGGGGGSSSMFNPFSSSFMSASKPKSPTAPAAEAKVVATSAVGSTGTSSAKVATVVATAIPQSAEMVAPPVILLNDVRLREIYTLLGVEELTASTAARRFTLPAIMRAGSEERLQIMLNLSRRWGSYRDDNALVQSLRDVAFVPRWRSGAAGDAQADEPTLEEAEYLQGPPRQPSELLSWTNDDLLFALQGPVQSRYFSPPELRTAELHVMLTDLGMTSELVKEKFLRIAGDIEATAVNDKGDGVLKQQAAERGRRLLRYIQDDMRSSALFDIDLAKKLSKLAIVPVQMPVGMDPGGFMHFRTEVCRFEQVLAGQHGMLGFTVLPVLDDDLAPSQIYFSSLGITMTPPVEVVLRHLRNLTSQGDLLDRWNHPQYTPKGTMGAIFQFLHEHWRDVSPNVKSALLTTPLVPVGHYLVTPSRLFFRLSEDLSPFMHEVPRIYGAHEHFLKQVGVKECPSALDYSQFLKDLAAECRDSALNPNELRAVIAIVQSVASSSPQRDEEEAQKTSAGKARGGGGTGSASAAGGGGGSGGEKAISETLFVPDENSVLRSVLHCLVNDDSWLRNRAGGAVDRAGFHFLHPSIGFTVASTLQVPAISDVLVERLQRPFSASAQALGLKSVPGSYSAVGPATDLGGRDGIMGSPGVGPEPVEGEPQLQLRFHELLTSADFVASVAALVVDSKTVLAPGASSMDKPASPAAGTASSSASGSGGPRGSGADADGREGAEYIAKQLAALHLRFVSNLPTYLVLLDTRRSPTRELDLEDTAAEDSEALTFLEDARTGSGSGSGSSSAQALYVNCSALAPPITMEIAVGLGLCKLLHLSTSIAASLACLMVSASAAIMAGGASTETGLGLRSRQVLAALRVGSDPATVRERLRGMPGERLSEVDRLLLELKPFRIFRAGEIVVYNSSGTGKKNSGNSGEESGNTVDSDAVEMSSGNLRYAKVVASGEGEEGASVRRVVIKTGAGLSTVLSTDLYSFKTAREMGRLKAAAAAAAGIDGSGAAGSTASGRSGSSFPSMAFGKFSRASLIGSAGGGGGLSSKADSSTAAAMAGTATGVAGASATGAPSLEPVGREELLNAMSGLLTRAGIPAGMETKDMMSRIVELGGSVKRLESELQQERAQMVESKEAMARMSAAVQCQICLINRVNQVLVPCGHILCETCVGQLQRSKCPFCRRNIQQKVRFYSPGASDDPQDGASADV